MVVIFAKNQEKKLLSKEIGFDLGLGLWSGPGPKPKP
jgi:hypothetical protein